MTENEIIEICKKYNIQNYTINSDMSIDVDGNVDLYNEHLTEFPLNFGKVVGWFDCSKNTLTSLNGCPKHIDGDFLCYKNELTSLEYGPSYVGGDFSCSNNKLTTLKDLPINFYIGYNFNCYSNNITSPTEFGKLFFGTIVGTIKTGYDNLNDFITEYKNLPKKDLPKILSKLRKIQL